jgi:hypothetical protein
MWEAIVAVIGLVGSAAGAIWASYVGTRRRVLAELEARYDADLRGQRLKVYPKLWATLEPLAKYARDPSGYPTRGEIAKLATRLRGWYFNDGGLYLSAEARQAYFHLQDALTALITSPRWAADGRPSDELDADTFESVRKIGSWLRTALTYDVGTRRRFSLAPAWQEEDAKANERAIEEDRSAKRDAELMVHEIRSRWA